MSARMPRVVAGKSAALNPDADAMLVDDNDGDSEADLAAFQQERDAAVEHIKKTCAECTDGAQASLALPATPPTPSTPSCCVRLVERSAHAAATPPLPHHPPLLARAHV